MGVGGYSIYRRPVSYISIDVNPSIELAINRFDKVVSAKGYNADGQDILQHVPLKNISYMQAIDRLMQDAYYSRFLNKDSHHPLHFFCYVLGKFESDSEFHLLTFHGIPPQ